jgi:hypothetical protein
VLLLLLLFLYVSASPPETRLGTAHGLLVAVLVLAHAHGVKQATCTEEGYELTAHVPDPPVRRSVPFVPVPVPRAGAA